MFFLPKSSSLRRSIPRYKLTEWGVRTKNRRELVAKYFRYLLNPSVFARVWRLSGRRRRWLKRRRVLRRWRYNRRSSKVWRKVGLLNTRALGRSSRRLKVLKDFHTKKLLLDFLAWKFSMSKKRLKFLIDCAFRRHSSAEDHVANIAWSLLSRWDSILFYTGLVKNRFTCSKMIANKGIYINGRAVTNIVRLSNLVEVGDALTIRHKYRTFFRRFWRYRNRRVWPSIFEYNRRICTWVVYRKLSYFIISRYSPQILRFLAQPLLIDRILGRLRYR
jgi:ribosomal 50S subunit-recycling heat shock protein